MHQVNLRNPKMSSGLLWHRVLSIAGMLFLVASGQAVAQSASISGNVVDAIGKPVQGIAVRLENGGTDPVAANTDSAGSFTFSDVPIGTYKLSAEKPGLGVAVRDVQIGPQDRQKRIALTLTPAKSSTGSQAMEFSDKPNFTVAGVTDWTAVGGHGSDAILRTSEDLSRETSSLKGNDVVSRSASLEDKTTESKLRAALSSSPEAFQPNHDLGELYLRSGRYKEAVVLLESAYRTAPGNKGNEYDLALAYQGAGDLSKARAHVDALLAREDTADLHRLIGEIDEKQGDPLGAVKEEELAAHLEPSEPNYFAWGSELLAHRAIWQALEVFEAGAKAYPKSARMLSALGAALFASARYDNAAQWLCEASDLEPEQPGPYLSMGKVEIAAPTPLPCIEERLARFANRQPENSQANYLYAMAILKRRTVPEKASDLQHAEELLKKAVAADPKCGDAYLQLGLLASKQRDTDKAISYYKSAVEATPELAEAHYRLGVTYDRLGEAGKAKQEFYLHDKIEAEQAAAVERDRRAVKQFLVVLQGQPAPSQTR